METHPRLAVLVTTVVLAAAGATAGGAQGTGAQALSETLAELNALGLQVEVQAVEATGVQSTTVPLSSSSGAGAACAPATENRAQESVWDRVRDIFGPVFRRTADRLIEDAIEGIRDACRINLTADDQGFELAFVAVSPGGVTASFRPSREFCEQVPMTD